MNKESGFDLRVWFVEDDPEYKDLIRLLERAWRHHFGGRLTVEDFDSADEALEKFRSASPAVDLLVCDLLYKQGKSLGGGLAPDGLKLIREVALTSRTVVFGVTTGMKGRDLAQEARDAGVHVFRIREQFQTTGAEDPWKFVCKEIYDRAIQLEVLRDSTSLDYAVDDPRMEYIVGEVGRRNLVALSKHLLGSAFDPDRIHVSFLAPGLSGAFVVSMTAEKTGELKRRHVLKISRSKDDLEKELKRRPDGSFRPGLILSYKTESGVARSPDGIWFGLLSTFQSDAVSLQETLQQSKDNRYVATLLRSLFFDGGLGVGYSSNLARSKRPAAEFLEQSASRQARVVTAMREFGPILKSDLVGEKDWDEKAKVLESFLRHRNVKDVDCKDTPIEGVQVYAHGDLHTKNVLVSIGDTPHPIVIDTAEFGIHHWANDLSRLLVDSVMSAHDSGPLAYDWRNIDRWRNEVTAALQVSGASRPNASVALSAVAWIMSHWPMLFRDVLGPQCDADRGWELNAAIAMELLRSSYRIDLTAPKRVLGLLLAYDVLEKARQLLEPRRKSFSINTGARDAAHGD